MALQPIPLNCSSSTLCRSSSLHSLFFQPPTLVTIKFRVSCSNQTAGVQTQQQVKTVKKKKKTNHRPSFFHQIQDKWSHKLGSQREKFPWQELQDEEEQRHQHHHHQQQQPPKEERHEKLQNTKKPPESNFQFPKRFSPWPQAVNSSNARFASESYDSEEENDIEGVKGSGGEERERMVRKAWNVSEGVNGERKKRRSNTVLAERTIPEHELRRLRKIALRMMERFNVGVKGVTQELVASVHEKWRESEVVKFKFGIPLSTHMKKAHQLLEVFLSFHSFAYLYASLENLIKTMHSSFSI